MSRIQQAGLVTVILAIALGIWMALDPGAASIGSKIGLTARDSDPAVKSQPGNDQYKNGQNNGTNEKGGRSALVVVSGVGTAAINDKVSALGEGEALRSVRIVPLSSGIITSIDVREGEKIKAGQVLFRIDSRVEQIARDRAALALQVARDKVDRFEKLVRSKTMTEVQLVDARNELANAELQLRDADVELSQKQVTAPFDGMVGIVPVGEGRYVTQQDELATLDDRSSILLDFWVPERFAALVTPDQSIEASAIAFPGQVFEGRVSAISSRVEQDSRTLQVRAVLDNSKDVLRPGMSFKVSLHFQGESHPAVDPLAIQWSSSGPYVWKLVEDKAHKVQIAILQRNSDFVLVSGEVEPGDELVVEGLQSLREGAGLEVMRRNSPPSTEG
ncbi:MAG: efflux RND transporter periplasmic adaptor subunit [Rhizobiaceae bacterium]